MLNAANDFGCCPLKFLWLREFCQTKWGQGTIEAPVMEQLEFLLESMKKNGASDKTGRTRKMKNNEVADVLGVASSTITRLSANLSPTKHFMRLMFFGANMSDVFIQRDQWLAIAIAKPFIKHCVSGCRHENSLIYCDSCKDIMEDAFHFGRYWARVYQNFPTTADTSSRWFDSAFINCDKEKVKASVVRVSDRLRNAIFECPSDMNINADEIPLLRSIFA